MSRSLLAKMFQEPSGKAKHLTSDAWWINILKDVFLFQERHYHASSHRADEAYWSHGLAKESIAWGTFDSGILNFD